MGLDITAVSKAVRVFPPAEAADGERFYDWASEQDLIVPWVNSDFPGREDEIVGGAAYKYASSMRFCAGSYSGYGEWRRWLCRVMLLAETEAVWENPGAFAGRPFLGLINFADNEGTIGPDTSARLALNFEQFDIRALAGSDGLEDRRYVKYQTWREAFALAADDGFVVFH